MEFIAFSKNDRTKCYRFEAESELEAANIALNSGYDEPRQVFTSFKIPKGMNREEAEAYAEAVIESRQATVH